jgi:hypothetical protein
MSPSDAQRLKSLEHENRRLKKLLAESMLDVAALKDLLAEMYGPPRPRKAEVDVRAGFAAMYPASRERAGFPARP